MSCNVLSPRQRLGACLALFFVVSAGCSSLPHALRGDDPGPDAALVYYQGLGRLTPAELARERSILNAVPQTPFSQLRQAMLLGHPRVQQEPVRAMALLDGVLKSTDPAALPFQPLARLLADNYGERTRLDGQLEKQAQNLKDSQRKVSELQEKLDSLADIERTLTPRPRSGRPEGGRR